MLKTIEQIRQHQFIGNYDSDSLAFCAIDRFALNKHNSIAHRAESLRIMGKFGMGLEGEDNGDHLTDSEIVNEYVESCK